MIEVAIILLIGAFASIAVLIIAPLPLIYTAAFVTFTLIFGIFLWHVSASLFRAIGVQGNPLSDVVVECLDEKAPGRVEKETDKTLLHEPRSPASDADSGFVDSARDLVCAEPVGGEQRDIGRKGGKKHAESMTPEKRAEIAKKTAAKMHV